MEILGKYAPGDRIFAKVKGFPHWPAVITKNDKARYEVFFYGTFEVNINSKPLILYYYKSCLFLESQCKRRINFGLQFREHWHLNSQAQKQKKIF